MTNVITHEAELAHFTEFFKTGRLNKKGLKIEPI